jgi:carbon monoxide dehydrogenase subunit G
MTTRIEERIAVAAPPEAVWEAVTDWAGQDSWMLGTTIVPGPGPGGRGVGERLTAVTALGPVRFDDLMEVTLWDPPHRVDVRHLGKVVRGTGSFIVEPAPGGAWLTWVEDLELPLGRAGQAGFTMVGPLARGGLRLSLRRLARDLEARSRPGASRPKPRTSGTS